MCSFHVRARGGRGNASGAAREGEELNLLQILTSPYQSERKNPSQLHAVWTLPCGLGSLVLLCLLTLFPPGQAVGGWGGMGLFSPGAEHLRLSVPHLRLTASVCCHKSWGTMSLRPWSPAIPPASHRVSLRVQVKPVSPAGWMGGMDGAGWPWSGAAVGQSCSPSCCTAKELHEVGQGQGHISGRDPASPLLWGVVSLTRAALKSCGKGSAKLCSQAGVCCGRGCGAMQSTVQPCRGETKLSEEPKQAQEPALGWCRGLLVAGHAVFFAALLPFASIWCLKAVPWQQLLGFPSVPGRCSRWSHSPAITHRCVTSGAIPPQLCPACCSCSAEQLNQ